MNHGGVGRWLKSLAHIQTKRINERLARVEEMLQLSVVGKHHDITFSPHCYLFVAPAKARDVGTNTACQVHEAVKGSRSDVAAFQMQLSMALGFLLASLLELH